MNALDILQYAGLVLIQALWAMLPAYVANPAAVLVGGGTPIDFGKNWKDGRRILGNGKSWRGLFGGAFLGMCIGFIQIAIVRLAGISFLEDFAVSGLEYGFIGVLFTLGFGAMLGDTAKSFWKRRKGFERGQKSPYLIDSYDFMIGAWLLTMCCFWTWFWSAFTLWHLLAVALLTPALHRLVNIIGYKMGKKAEPW